MQKSSREAFLEEECIRLQKQVDALSRQLSDRSWEEEYRRVNERRPDDWGFNY